MTALLLTLGALIVLSMMAYLYALERRPTQHDGDEIANGDWPHVPSEISSFHSVGE